MVDSMTISLRGLAKAIESGHPTYLPKGPAALRLAADEIDRLRTIVRVNGLRWGHTHAEIDALLAATHTSGERTNAKD